MIVVFGGTGTLGQEILKQLKGEASKIVVVSRDEHKQQRLKREFPYVEFHIGDIRSLECVRKEVQSATLIFNVAAMKHVDLVEENIEEAFLTNVVGSFNISQAVTELTHPVKVVFSSTDKAVLPINAYGLQKALVEKHYLHMGKRQFCRQHDFYVFRWGNVMGSNGSVVHLFVESLETDRAVYITDRRMTRFWINIEDAVRFMFEKVKQPAPGVVLYPQMKAATVERVANAIAKFKGYKLFDVVEVGMRPGEKLHECLDSNHKFCIRSDTAPQLTDDELDLMLRRVLCSAS